MKFYGAEYNNIELGFASFNIVVLCSIESHIDLVQCSNCIILYFTSIFSLFVFVSERSIL
jgi:hypothetical protein